MKKSEEVIAAGGVLYSQEGEKTKVLLIHRRGVWDLPKGKVEQNESHDEGACREVEEETGCGDIRIQYPLGSTRHTYRENDKTIQKTTWWYAMQSERPCLKPQQEEQIDGLKWVSLEEAIRMVYYDNLKEVLSRFALNLSGTNIINR